MALSSTRLGDAWRDTVIARYTALHGEAPSAPMQSEIQGFWRAIASDLVSELQTYARVEVKVDITENAAAAMVPPPACGTGGVTGATNFTVDGPAVGDPQGAPATGGIT